VTLANQERAEISKIRGLFSLLSWTSAWQLSVSAQRLLCFRSGQRSVGLVPPSHTRSETDHLSLIAHSLLAYEVRGFHIKVTSLTYALCYEIQPLYTFQKAADLQVLPTQRIINLDRSFGLAAIFCFSPNPGFAFPGSNNLEGSPLGEAAQTTASTWQSASSDTFSLKCHPSYSIRISFGRPRP
jgi:hypothetical protein